MKKNIKKNFVLSHDIIQELENIKFSIDKKATYNELFEYLIALHKSHKNRIKQKPPI